MYFLNCLEWGEQEYYAHLRTFDDLKWTLNEMFGMFILFRLVFMSFIKNKEGQP